MIAKAGGDGCEISACLQSARDGFENSSYAWSICPDVAVWLPCRGLAKRRFLS